MNHGEPNKKVDFSSLANRYDAWYQTPLGKLANTLEQEAVFNLAEAKPGEWAIDIGSGTGIYALELARKGIRVIGVDPSLEMIAIAREKFRQAGLEGHFICGTAEALPVRSNQFDLALAVTSLCFAGQPDRAIEEMHRVMKPGGRLVLGELNRFSLWAFVRRLKGLFMDTIYNRAHFWGQRELKQLLLQKGFHSILIQSFLYFPPINQTTFLKSYRLFERGLSRIVPGTGAFLAVRAERK